MAKLQRTLTIENKSALELFNKIESEIDHLLQKVPAQFGNFEVQKDFEGKTLTIASKIVKASMLCQENRIELTAELGFLATPFKGKIDEWLNHWIKKTFSV